MARTALITGGSRGIGLGIARELGMAGFHLIINGVREEKEVSTALDALREVAPEVVYVQGDVSVQEDRERVFQEAVRTAKTLHVLVNNAGVAPLERTDILEATGESYDRVMEINLKGPYFLTQLAARHMIICRKEDPEYRGCIINISSISSTVASTNRGEYCISKAGISMATRLWAVRLGEFDIPVYEIRPGLIRTDMTRGVEEKYDGLIAGGLTLQGRWGLPADVGKVAAAMASGSMPYSTGAVVMVDGGLTTPRL